MVRRAVHLKTVKNLSALKFLTSLRRCIARRGKLKIANSDNAINFALGREIITFLEIHATTPTSKVQNHFSNEGIDWKFNSPWKGSFYKCMVGVMKSNSKRKSRKKLLNDNEFTTFVLEVVINSWSLTYARSTVEDSVVLRPIDFNSIRRHQLFTEYSIGQ